MAYKTGNPALNARTFEEYGNSSGNLSARGSSFQASSSDNNTMTLEGTVQKSFLLIALVIIAGAFSWMQISSAPASILSMSLLWGGVIAGAITSFVIIFNKPMAPMLAPLYAIFEGLALGGISAMYNAQYQGIVLQAVELTVAVFIVMLLSYTSRLIQATQNFRLGVVAATGGICLVYIVDIAMSFFGHPVPFIHDSGPWGIGISIFIVVIAALNLVLDFDFIEQGSQMNAPKYMEWYGAFGLLITLVWLYLEILRLLAKTRRK